MLTEGSAQWHSLLLVLFTYTAGVIKIRMALHPFWGSIHPKAKTNLKKYEEEGDGLSIQPSLPVPYLPCALALDVVN